MPCKRQQQLQQLWISNSQAIFCPPVFAFGQMCWRATVRLVKRTRTCNRTCPSLMSETPWSSLRIGAYTSRTIQTRSSQTAVACVPTPTAVGWSEGFCIYHQGWPRILSQFRTATKFWLILMIKNLKTWCNRGIVQLSVSTWVLSATRVNGLETMTPFHEILSTCFDSHLFFDIFQKIHHLPDKFCLCPWTLKPGQEQCRRGDLI